MKPLRLMQVSDLHWCAPGKQDAAYCQEVWEEICTLAVAHEVQLLLLCGDIFDDHDALRAQQDAFRASLEALDGLPVVLLPGNHELLSRSGRGSQQEHGAHLALETAFAAVDLQPAKVCMTTPFTRLAFAELELEILAVPYQERLGGFLNWPVPELPSGWRRIGMCHGVVTNLTSGVIDEEGASAVIDPRLARHLELTYVALGHIHKRNAGVLEGITFHYPGSARVWRRGEGGERKASLLEFSEDAAAPPRIEALTLRRAGRYLELPCRVSSLEDASRAPDALLADHSLTDRDWLVLQLEGVVDTEIASLDHQRALRSALEGRVRRLDLETQSLIVAERLGEQPLARAFLREWESRWDKSRHNQAHETALRWARNQALQAMGKMLINGIAASER